MAGEGRLLVVAAGDVDQVEARIAAVEVVGRGIVEVAIGADIAERRERQVPLDLQAHPPGVAVLVAGIGAGGLVAVAVDGPEGRHRIAGVEIEHVLGRSRLAAARAVDGRQDAQVRLGLSAQGDAAAARVPVLHPVAREGVADIAFVGAPGAAEPQRGVAVRERRVEHRRAFQPFIVADGGLGRRIERPEPRPRRDDVDRPADHVAAEERALRTLEHLDPLHVEGVEGHGRRAADIDLVQEDRGAGIAGRAPVRGADAADGHARLRGGEGVELQARRQPGHVLDLADARLLAPLGAEGGDGHRHVLQALAAPLGGDDHLFQHAHRALLARRLRMGVLAAQQGRRGHAARPHGPMFPHVPIPSSSVWPAALRGCLLALDAARQHFGSILLTD